ncbi:pseudouridine synthase [Chytridium lagenaria]|nr:pseudouridine synthase [Chytridium lagenaria]
MFFFKRACRGFASGRRRKEETAVAATAEKAYKVEDAQNRVRLDAFVASAAGVRRSMARLKILNGEVQVSGSLHARMLQLKPNDLLHAGDTVRVLFPTKPMSLSPSSTGAQMDESLEDLAESLKKQVLYKDQHIIIINKPPGLPVQGGSKVKIHLDQIFDKLKFQSEEKPRLVHRLDKDTTGALVLARTKEAATKVGKMFEGGENVLKTYLALVHGTVEKENGVIDTGMIQHGEPPNERISLVEWHRADDVKIDKGIMEQGIKKATTSYQVLSQKRHVALVKLAPVTGRKHQLRLHCARILNGCPKVLTYGCFEGTGFNDIKAAFGNIKRDWFGSSKDSLLRLHYLHTSRKPHFTELAPKAIGPYSQAIAANGFLYTAGQVPFDPVTMEVVGSEIQTQTAQALKNLRAVVEAGGSSFDRVVKTTVFLKNMNDFADMNKYISEHFGDARPARSLWSCTSPRDVR